MKRLLKAFAYSCILAAITVFSVASFWQNQIQLTAIIIVVSAAMLLILRTREELYLYIIVSITGALAETLAIASGAWTYAMPDFIGIPIWLPFLWGLSGVFINRVTMEIKEFLKK